MITVDHIHKPHRTVATATARLTATGATYRDVLDTGLRALGETPGSVFGCGVRDEEGWNMDPRDDTPLTGEFTVYAHRD